MKKVIVKIFLSSYLFSSVIYANSPFPLNEKIDIQPAEDELVAIERLIFLTENQVEAQKTIKKLIINLRRDKELFLMGDQSKLHALYMIESATQMLTLIRTYHLDHLFPSDFIEELALFSQVGKK